MKSFLSFLFVFIFVFFAGVAHAETMSGGGFTIDGKVTPIAAFSSSGTFTLGASGEAINVGGSSGGGISAEPGFTPPAQDGGGSTSGGGGSSGGHSLSCALSSTPAVISKGGSASLSWTLRGATSITLLGVARVEGGSVSVSPSVTTTYVGSVGDGVATVYCYKVVTVVPEEIPAPVPATDQGQGVPGEDFEVSQVDEFKNPQECIGPDGKPCAKDIEKATGFAPTKGGEDANPLQFFVENGEAILYWMLIIAFIIALMSSVMVQSGGMYVRTRMLAKLPLLGFAQREKLSTIALAKSAEAPLMVEVAIALVYVGALAALVLLAFYFSLLSLAVAVVYALTLVGRVRTANFLKRRVESAK